MLKNWNNNEIIVVVEIYLDGFVNNQPCPGFIRSICFVEACEGMSIFELVLRLYNCFSRYLREYLCDETLELIWIVYE